MRLLTLLIVGPPLFIIEWQMGEAINAECLRLISSVDFPMSGLLVTVLGIGDLSAVAANVGGVVGWLSLK